MATTQTFKISRTTPYFRDNGTEMIPFLTSVQITAENYIVGNLIANDIIASTITDANNVKFYGAKGDGIVDDTAAFTAAIASGKSCIYIPSGTYKLNPALIPTGGWVIPANFCLIGNGVSSMLRFEPLVNTTFFYLFKINNNNIIFKNFAIEWIGVVNISAGPIVFDMQNCNNVLFSDLNMNMNVSVVAGNRSWFSAFWNCTGFTATNVTVKNCYCTNFVWGFLKSNTSIGTEQYWTFQNNFFSTYFAPVLTINTPSGVSADFKTIGNTFLNSQTYLIGSPGSSHAGGVAGGANCTDHYYAGNKFLGTGTGLHFEEGAAGVIITGNYFGKTDSALEVLDNHVGVQRTPSKFVITGNEFVQTGTPVIDTTPGTLRGIDLIADAGGFPPLVQYIISDNYIFGYYYGITTAEQSYLGSFSNNYIEGCTAGLRTYNADMGINDNTFYNNTSAIEATTRGGMIGANRINYDPATQAILTTLSGQSVGIAGFKRDIYEISLPTGASTVTLFAHGTRMDGQLSLSLVSAAGTSERITRYTLNWDGASLTQTALTLGGAGAIVFGGTVFAESAGNILVNITNGSGAIRLAYLQMDFVGVIFFT
jgi:hypothetical protein